MFVRKLSGVSVRASLMPDGEVVEHPRVDGLDSEPDPAEVVAAQARYEDFLADGDFSTAGDLLPFFARDFFHDSAFEGLTIDGSAMRVSFRASTWVEIADDGLEVAFDITFDKVAWFSVEAVAGDYGEYGFAEIDGLADRIVQAQERFGGVFHSLAIETGWGGWVSLVFESVSVVPVDRIGWLKLLRDPAASLPTLYGLE